MTAIATFRLVDVAANLFGPILVSPLLSPLPLLRLAIVVFNLPHCIYCYLLLLLLSLLLLQLLLLLLVLTIK
jgi:hypothetical protein